ncbi:type III secretion system protein SctK [Cupriavidus sp. MP-37]|uniref:type III secretion system protein SctK n=1 Tax=Cupriavidus sp. MP-37 TaxID=2884455 RepID=UPI001D0ABA91|nr:type III secretion system protein SctK [Cupriavidus sp. MP-37]UDM53174.1 type III secretion system protein SctK [Cupriavidus sp. MP-37]
MTPLATVAAAEAVPGAYLPGALAAALAPAPPALPDPALARAMADLAQRPLAHLHPSWLPADWPLAWRRADRFGPAAAEVLAQPLGLAGDAARDAMLHRLLEAPPSLARLVLLPRSDLRLLAWWLGLAVHQAGFASERRMLPAQLADSIAPLPGALAAPLLGSAPRAMRRAARRLDRHAVAFILKRVPALPALPMNLAPLRAHPAGTGRLMAERGYRLLCGLLAADAAHAEKAEQAGHTAPLLQALQRKFPRRLAALSPAPLTPAQAAQLRELLLLNLIPERFPAWHWLF